MAQLRDSFGGKVTIAPDHRLATLLAAGDASAWQDFVKAYEALIHHWCRRAGVPAQDIADLTQYVFLRVLQNVRRFRPNGCPGCFRGWLRKITDSTLAVYFRVVVRCPDVLPPDRLPETFRAAGEENDPPEIIRLWPRIQAELSEEDSTILWRSEVDGDSNVEIAADMKISESAVRQRKSRALCLLRQELRAEFGGGGRHEEIFCHTFLLTIVERLLSCSARGALPKAR